MQEGVERYGHQILAFCFMSNHVHLAIQLGNVSLSKICQNLAFRYTRFYNRRHNTIGHLFQGRFKSILVDGNSYLRKLIRYIHLNPVRAHITDNPLNYQWSSHQAYLMQNEFTWLARDTGLQFFGVSKQDEIETFYHFIMSGISQDDGIDFKQGITAGIIGDDLFIERMKGEDDDNEENRLLDIDLTALLCVVGDWYNVDMKKIQESESSRNASKIRAVVTLLARDICREIRLNQIACFFCRTDSSLSQAATRLEIRIRGSERLRHEISDLKQKLLSEVTFAQTVKCEA